MKFLTQKGNYMRTSIDDRFANARRASRVPVKGMVMKTNSMMRLAAASVIRECLDGQSGGFSTREVFESRTEFVTSYRTANALGTALGDGVRGKGMGLHRDLNGKFLRCRDNAALAATNLTDDEFAALAFELELPDPDALADLIDQLPAAPNELSA
jgi:hypothetical protein